MEFRGLNPRLARLEASIEAIAIEVERNGELQRWFSRSPRALATHTSPMSDSLTRESESGLLSPASPASAVSPARYATFTSRFRALLIDTALVFAALVILLLLGEFGDRIPGSDRVVWVLTVSLLFLYEPLFIWRRGATIGHSAKHLRVVSTATGEPPGFRRALARYLIKVVLGLPSFVTMGLSRRHQAVHDMLTQTTVQLSSSAHPAVDAFHLERTGELDVALPSRSRRFVVVAVYILALFFGYGAVLLVIDPERCVQARSCSADARLAIDALALVWLCLSVGVVVAGWKGYLLGARRVRANAERLTTEQNG